jgi:nucleotide-binding universal stress UspA family protein
MRALTENPTIAAIRNVLFATDFSEASDAALPYVDAIGQRYRSIIHVVHVVPEVVFLRSGAADPALIGSLYEDAHSGARHKIARVAERLPSLPHYSHIRHGHTSTILAEMVRDDSVDLLVCGTHGRTGLGKLVMGSVAEEILRVSPCPVLTVGPNVVGTVRRNLLRDRDAALPNTYFKRILYATDLRSDSSQAVAYAVSLAAEFDSQLSLLHVIEDYGNRLSQRPNPLESSRDELRKLIPADSGIYPEFLAQFGVPAESILQTASEREADLIILGVRPDYGHLNAATHFGRAVAHRVIVGAHCPVLTVRG